ncbi:unnamed protein product [Closterium sp. NIES-53]
MDVVRVTSWKPASSSSSPSPSSPTSFNPPATSSNQTSHTPSEPTFLPNLSSEPTDLASGQATVLASVSPLSSSPDFSSSAPASPSSLSSSPSALSESSMTRFQVGADSAAEVAESAQLAKAEERGDAGGWVERREIKAVKEGVAEASRKEDEQQQMECDVFYGAVTKESEALRWMGGSACATGWALMRESTPPLFPPPLHSPPPSLPSYGLYSAVTKESKALRWMGSASATQRSPFESTQKQAHLPVPLNAPPLPRPSLPSLRPCPSLALPYPPGEWGGKRKRAKRWGRLSSPSNVSRLPLSPPLPLPSSLPLSSISSSPVSLFLPLSPSPLPLPSPPPSPHLLSPSFSRPTRSYEAEVSFFHVPEPDQPANPPPCHHQSHLSSPSPLLSPAQPGRTKQRYYTLNSTTKTILTRNITYLIASVPLSPPPVSSPHSFPCGLPCPISTTPHPEICTVGCSVCANGQDLSLLARSALGFEAIGPSQSAVGLASLLTPLNRTDVDTAADTLAVTAAAGSAADAAAFSPSYQPPPVSPTAAASAATAAEADKHRVFSPTSPPPPSTTTATTTAIPPTVAAYFESTTECSHNSSSTTGQSPDADVAVSDSAEPLMWDDATPGWRTVRGRFHSVGGAVISCRNDKAPDGVAAHAHLADGNLNLIMIRECSRAEYLQ